MTNHYLNYSMLRAFQQMVDQFHIAFDHPSNQQPYLEDANLNALRFSLLDEEIKEYHEATMPEFKLDALLDIQYVLTGAALAWGLAGYYVGDIGAKFPSALDTGDLKIDICMRELCRLQKSLLCIVRVEGFSFCFWKAFEEVHRSNMSKIWKDSDVTEHYNSEEYQIFRITDGSKNPDSAAEARALWEN